MDGRQEPGMTTSQRPPLIVTVGEAVGDYMFRTVHALLSRMIHNMEDGHAVSALLRVRFSNKLIKFTQLFYTQLLLN